jgi:chromatin segregation and condensation protein Rec8/ScpA/Scc1 (kleisin family)
MRRFHIGSPEWSPPRVPLQLPLGFGSLGWLAHLIRKHKLDLTEVDLAPVAQACYDYWREVGDMDEAGDALATLAYLTERKAQRLLAPEPEPDDTADEWLAPTRLPDAYLRVAEHLRRREGARMQLVVAAAR